MYVDEALPNRCSHRGPKRDRLPVIGFGKYSGAKYAGKNTLQHLFVTLD